MDVIQGLDPMHAKSSQTTAEFYGVSANIRLQLSGEFLPALLVFWKVYPAGCWEVR